MGREGIPCIPLGHGCMASGKRVQFQPGTDGGSRSILEGGAISAVQGYSEGNARKIDNLMTDALTIGAQQEQHSINAETILAAANNQTLA